MNCPTTTTTTAPCESPVTAAELHALVPNPSMGLCAEVDSLITSREKIVDFFDFILNDEGGLSDGGKCLLCLAADCALETTSTTTTSTSTTTTSSSTTTTSSSTTTTTTAECSSPACNAISESQNWFTLYASNDFSLVIAGTNSGLIQKSTNGGLTWADKAVGGAWIDVGGTPNGSTIIAINDTGSDLRSTDSGETWGGVSIDVVQPVMIALVSDLIYVAGGRNGTLSRTINGGGAWVIVVDGARAWKDIKVASGDTQKMIAVADGQLIYVSSNGGASWSSVETARDWVSCAISSDGLVMYAAIYNQIFKSSDSGLNWAMVKETSGTIRSISCSGDGEIVVATNQGRRISASTDGGGTWQSLCQCLNWWPSVISDDGTEFLVGHFGGNIYRFTVSGGVISN